MDNLYLSLSGNHHAFLEESPGLLLQLASARLTWRGAGEKFDLFLWTGKAGSPHLSLDGNLISEVGLLPPTLTNKLSLKPLERVSGNWRSL